MRKAIQKNAFVLATFAIVCTTIVGIVHSLTKDEIATQKQQQLIKQLSQVVNPDSHNNEMANDCFMIDVPELGSSTLQKAYLAKKDNTPVAVALTATAPDGYNGNIKMLIGIKADGVVSGVRVLEHNETPGLGDKVELRKDDWITSFNGKKSVEEQDPRWNVTKDGGLFDQFTGATITPRAVVKSVYKALTYFNNNKNELFSLQHAPLEADIESELTQEITKKSPINKSCGGDE
jgi:electron transport complex protein RnfG